MAPRSLTRLFAAHVRAQARARRLSINRLADFAGLSRGFMSEMLRARKTPTLDTVEKIADALEVEPWRLLRPSPNDG